jgi:hypothetical protein
LEGERATESVRAAAAGVIQRRIREIEAETPGTPVVILGDLNENHDEFYRISGAYLCALLPDDEEAAELAAKTAAGPAARPSSPGTGGDFLVLSGEKPPRSEYFSGATAFYSPWERELQGGSYYFREKWETIDHLLLNSAFFDGSGWEFDSCAVLNRAPFVNAQGLPQAYNPRTGYGLSDHLPLALVLKNTEPQ